MKRFTLVAAALAAAVVLAACSVSTTPPGPPADTIDVSPGTASSAAYSITLDANDGQVFRVDLSGAATSDLVYIELDRDLRLEVVNSGYTSVLYSARSSDYFGSGLSGATAAAATGELTGQTVTAPVTCRGSCVLLDDASGSYYVRVLNTTASTVNGVNLYIYGDSYADGTEDDNDAPATSPGLSAFDAGAIETVGDVDFWFMENSGTVSFDVVVGGIPLEVEIVDASGNVVSDSGGPYGNGDDIQVFGGEFLRVWAVDPNRAAASANSQYYLEYLEAPLSQSNRR